MLKFGQIQSGEIHFTRRNTFCNFDETKYGGGVHSSTAQSRLSLAEAGGGGSARCTMLLLLYLIFLICLLFAQRFKHIFEAKYSLCIFRPSVLLMAHVSRRIECVLLQIRFWKGTKLGVEFHTHYISTTQ